MKIYQGNCLDVLRGIDDNSIDLIVTSPPYYNLRVYSDSPLEIGREETRLEFILKLEAVFKQCYRVLKPTGSLWVNINDVYINQSLACIPDMLKIRLVKLGYLCRNEIIWQKPNAMPSSAKTRFNQDYEKFYFFTKTSDYYFKTQYEPYLSNVGKTNFAQNESKYESVEQESSVRQGMNRARGTKVIVLRKNLPEKKVFLEYIRSNATVDNLVKDTGITSTLVAHWFRSDNCFAYPTLEEWNKVKRFIDNGSKLFKELDAQLTDVTYETDDIYKNKDKGRIKRAVWNISTKALKMMHYAPFPKELVEIPIDACCPVGGIVLDPFMGSGTTGVVAINKGCDFIGIDLNPNYCEMAKERILNETINKGV